MQRPLKQIIAESRILKAALVFFLAYVVLLILWIQAKDIYRYGIIFVASKFVAGVKDAKLEEIITKGHIINVAFSSLKVRGYLPFDVPIVIASFAFNVPLTLSMLISLSLFIRRRMRAFMEALLLLLLFDFFLVFFFETYQLSTGFILAGVEKTSLIRLSVYQFLWKAMDYASMSFEPFLIVTYIYVRFRK